MLKRINAGELRTQIIIMALVEGCDAEGYPVKRYEPIYDDGISVGCKWVNVHGREVYEAERLNLREAATITMRYTPLVNARCRIYKRDELWAAVTANKPTDGIAYEIISMDDMQERHEWLEIKVQRVVVA